MRINLRIFTTELHGGEKDLNPPSSSVKLRVLRGEFFFFFFLTLLSLFITGCADPVSPRPPKAEPGKDQPLPAGYGFFTPIIAHNTARTILPDAPALTDFVRFELIFTPVDDQGAALTVDRDYADSGVLEPVPLSAGIYDLLVNAYNAAGNIAARGTLENIKITADENEPRTISLDALFGDGAGTFTWDITLNASPITIAENTAVMIIKDSNDAVQEPVEMLLSSGITSGSRALPSGLYTVVFIINGVQDNVPQTLVWNELLHVYAELESKFSIIFTARHFTNTHWNVTFNENYDGAAISLLPVKHNSVIEAFPEPVRDGYTFGGWYKDKEAAAGNLWAPDEGVTDNITLYAKWTVSYTVTFNKNNHDTDSAPANPTSKTVTPPATTVDALPAAPTRIGHTFADWNTQADGSGTKFDETTTVSANITVHAQWTAHILTINYDSGGGSGPAPDSPTSAVYGTDVTMPANTYTLPGYTFVGWAVSGTDAIEETHLPNTPVSVTDLSEGITRGDASITLTAKWVEEGVYLVTFNKNASDATDANPASKTVKPPDTTIDALPAAPTRIGHTFTGWNTKADGSGTDFYQTTPVSEIISVYAQWTVNTLTIEYNSGGGTGPTTMPPYVPTLAAYGTNVDMPGNFYTRAGHMFAGWSVSGKDSIPGTHPVGASVAVTALSTGIKTGNASIILTAEWTPEDTIPPVITFTSINRDGSSEITEPNAVIQGVFYDDSNLGYEHDGSNYYFEYRIYRDDGFPAPAYVKRDLGSNPGKVYTLSIPLTGTGPDSHHEFWDKLDEIPDGKWWLDIKVADRLGNEEQYEGSYAGSYNEALHNKRGVAFYVNRKAPEIKVMGDPKITEQNPTPIYTASSANPMIIDLRGTVTDGDLADIKIKLNNQQVTPNFYYHTSNAITYEWSWCLDQDQDQGHDASVVVQGLNTITITATDMKGRKSELTYTFIKDTMPPKVDFTNLKEVYITKDTWESIKSMSPEGLAVLDTISVLSDPNPEIRGVFADMLTSIGYLTDPPGQYYFEYRLYSRKIMDQPPEYLYQYLPPWKSILLGANTSPQTNWTIPLYGKPSNFWPPDSPEIPDGLYWLDIRVADRGGNETTITNLAFCVDRNAPMLTLKSPDNNIYNTYREPFALTGTALDANFRNLTINVDNNYGVVVSSDQIIINQHPDGYTYDWIWPIDPIFSTLYEGQHTVTVTAYDYAGKWASRQYNFVKDTTPPVIMLNNINMDGFTTITDINPAIQGSFIDAYSRIGDNKSGDPYPNYYFEYRIYPDGSTNPPNYAIVSLGLGYDPGLFVNWTIPLAGPGSHSEFWNDLNEIPDGKWWLEIRVADRAGNVATMANNGNMDRIAFFVDRRAPEIMVTGGGVNSIYGPISGNSDTPVINLQGTVMDGNLAKLDISLVNAEGLAVNYTLPAVPTDNGIIFKWSWTLTLAEYNDLPEGPNTIILTAIDTAGRISELPYTFIKDLDPPKVDFFTINDVRINEDKWQDRITVFNDEYPVIRGSFEDALSSIGQDREYGAYYYFEYYLYSKKTMDETYPQYQDYKRLPLKNDTTKAENWTISLDAIPDGLYLLDIRVFDRIGNMTEITNLVFCVDRMVPMLALTSDNIICREPEQLKLMGTVKDSNFNKLTVKVDGAEEYEVPNDQISSGSGGDAYTWTWTIDETVFDGLSDGQHTLIVTAYDYGRNTDYKLYSFTKDTTKPLVILNTPDNNAPFTLTGSVVDLNFKELTVSLNGEVTLTPVLPNIYYTWTWTIDSTAFSNLSNGSHTLTITAHDHAGNTDLTTYTFTKGP